MIPHLREVAARPARLSAFPPCALCGCHVNDCDCDPDEAMGAALAARMNVALAQSEAEAHASTRSAWGMA